MQTFESVRAELPPAHVVLIEELLNKGLTFSGNVSRNGERFTTVVSTCGDVTIHSNGLIELFTDNHDPYEPYNCGYSAWYVFDDEIEDASRIAGFIVRMTGDE